MKAVEIISVPVSDQEKAKAFYLAMGLELIVEAPMGPDQKWIQLKFPEGGATIALVTWFPKMPAGSLQGAVIECENITDEIARLKAAGIEAGKIDQTPWGQFAAVADPDGNTWSLHQP